MYVEARRYVGGHCINSIMGYLQGTLSLMSCSIRHCTAEETGHISTQSKRDKYLEV